MQFYPKGCLFMLRHLTYRIAQAVPVLLMVSIVVFVFARLGAGDPAIALLGPDATQQQLDAMRHGLGLDRPLYVQYAIWLGNVLQGKFGISYSSGIPVTQLIGQKIPATLELAFFSALIGLLIAIPLGVLGALRHRSPSAYSVTAFASLGMAIPNFWLGILLVLFFAVRLHWLPPSGYVPFAKAPGDNLRHALLPAVTLGVALAAPIVRFLRAGMIEVLQQDFVRTARAKGLPERAVILRHAMKNALIPAVTFIGLQVARLLGGAVVIESVFSWPGLGWTTLQAIYQKDYALEQTCVLLLAVAFVTINLIVDLLYTVLDPRVKIS